MFCLPVDNKIIAINPAVEPSLLSKDEQISVKRRNKPLQSSADLLHQWKHTALFTPTPVIFFVHHLPFGFPEWTRESRSLPVPLLQC